jgi:TolB-like protein/Tfp pilus assembly protein PilF
MSSDISNLWQDLSRRRVFQVAAIYAAGAWVTVQVADVVGPAINMPNWIMTAIVGLAMVGFPIAVILAWIFDAGPGGVVRTKPGSATGIFAIVASLGLLIAGTAGFVWLIKPGQETEQFARAFTPIPDSVAVMPFTDLSADRSFDHFANGIAEVLIHKMSAIAQLSIIAIDSTLGLKEQGLDVQTIGQKLKVERLLMGSVQRSGNRFRISTRLVDTRTGKNVWSKQFDREDKDIFDIQDEIALAVAKEMDAPLEPEVRDRVTHLITEDHDAYDLYLLAQHEWRNTPLNNGNAKAIQLLEAALEKDPELALAWATLASIVFWHGTRGHISLDEGISRSREYLARALELDPYLSEAHSHAIVIAALVDNDLEGARRAFKNAINYGPSNWAAHNLFGMALNNRGQYIEAIDVLGRGLVLNPYKPEPWLRFNLGNAHMYLGQYDKGMQLLAANYADNKGTNLESQVVTQFGNAPLFWGRYDEAIAVFEIAIRDGNDGAKIRGLLAHSLLAIGDIEAAATQITLGEAIVAEQRAAGRTMNHSFWAVEDARKLLDMATNNMEHLLAEQKRILSAIENSERIWSEIRKYDAGLRAIILRRWEEAARLMDNYTVDLGNRSAEGFAYAAFAYQKIGDTDKAAFHLGEGQKELEKLLKVRHPSIHELMGTSLIEAAAGHTEEAIDALHSAYELGFRDHAYLAYMPLYDSVRSDPRFLEFLQTMRADTKQMLKRVKNARASSDWESLIARHFEN